MMNKLINSYLLLHFVFSMTNKITYYIAVHKMVPRPFAFQAMPRLPSLRSVTDILKTF